MAWWEERRDFARGYVAVWQSDEGVARIGALAGAVAVLQLLGALLFGRAGLPLVLAVPLAAIFGPAGAWGTAIGAVFGELALGQLGLSVAFEALGVLLAAFVGRTLWLQLAYPYRKDPLKAAMGMLPVTVVGTLLGTVFTAGAATLWLDMGLLATVPGMLLDHVILAVAVGPPIAIAGAHRDEIPVTGMTISPVQWLVTIVLVALITMVWLLGAVLIDVIRTAIRANPDLQEEIARRLPAVIDAAILYLSGPLGWTVQIVLAGIAIVLIVLAVTTTDRRPVRLLARRDPRR